MFSSGRKESQRNSHIKNTHKQSTGKLRAESTGLGLSVRFKEPRENGQEVREFTDDAPSFHPQAHPYPRGDLLKDVNYLNTIYNHILVMISSHQGIPTDPKNYQIAKMSKQIQSIIVENMQLKSEIDAKYRSMIDLQQLAEHIKATPIELSKGKLSAFLNEFEQKEEESRKLSSQLQQMEAVISKSKHGGVTNANIQQKQQKIKTLRRAIDKQRQKISKLQKQEKTLLGKLYDTQKLIVKNENSSSAIKLKLKEVQIDEKRIRSKTRETNKQNRPTTSNKDKKSIRGGQLQGVRLANPRHV